MKVTQCTCKTMQMLRWQSYCNVIQAKAYLNHFLLCMFMSKVTWLPVWDCERCKRRAVVFRVGDLVIAEFQTGVHFVYYLMKEAAVWCLVCCVGCPCSMLWVEMELLSFRKECQCANLLGFEVIEDLWGVSTPAWWWHLMQLGIACLYWSWGLGLACLHTTSMT